MTNDICVDCDQEMKTITIFVLGGIPKRYQECSICHFTAKASA
jgi:hypothetical protein